VRLQDRYYIDAATDCWVWRGKPKDTGYGQINIGGRVLNAHTMVYEMLVGPVPPGKELDHLCRVKLCVNPDHLEPVTHRENCLRGVGPSAKAAKATRCRKGHPYDEQNTYWRPDGKGRGCRTCNGWTGYQEPNGALY